jgi:xylulokinase
MAYLMGADFGGGSCKVTLLSEEGEVVASRSQEYRSYCPRPLFIEQRPEEIFQAFAENVQTLLKEKGLNGGDVEAIALDGGTHIAVLLDNEGKVIRPSIYWSDGRSTEEAAELRKTHLRLLEDATCNIPSSTWTLPQLMWLKKHEPDSVSRIHKILFLKDYIRSCLTGDDVTDSIEALGSMMYDYRTSTWNEELCALGGVSSTMLPSVQNPADIAGVVGIQAAEKTSLKLGTKVVVGSTDTVMELFSSGAINEGNCTVKLATAGRICVVSGKPVIDKCLVTYPHIVQGLWYPGTATKTCASSLRWFRDTLSKDGDSADAYRKIDEEASRIPVGCDGMFFHPYLQGELTPYQDNSLRASFTGVAASSTYGHFCRSVLEGVAYSLEDSMMVLKQLGLEPKGELKIIGGGSRSNLWAQIVSDVFGLPLVKVTTDDSSIGSCMLAGVATGVFGSLADAVDATTKVGKTFEPDAGNHQKYLHYFSEYRKMALALQSVYKEIEE